MNNACASLDRVIGRDVDPWLPSGASARLLRRLQNEMQMLLYTHPINEARAARRDLPINSLWFSGTGCLPVAMRAPQAVHLSRLLAPAAMAGDWAAYAQTWAQLDEAVLRPLLARQQAGQTIQLTLCGERGFVTLQSAGRGTMSWTRPRAASGPCSKRVCIRCWPSSMRPGACTTRPSSTTAWPC